MKNPIYQYPFLQLAEATLAVNMSGMAVRFLDLCEIIIEEKLKRNAIAPEARLLINESKIKLDKFRYTFFSVTTKSWHDLVHQHQLSSDQCSQVSEASHLLVQNARTIVNMLYPYCGLAAADTSEEINRVWRNFHTAGQHSLFSNRLS